jgi:pteridine reductase
MLTTEDYALKQTTKPAPVALITGAARRIGAAIALYLHEHGFRVVIHCHQSKAEADMLAQKMNQQRPDSALVLSADLTIQEEAINLINRAAQWAGQLDLLVNNASIFTSTSSKNAFDDAHWDALFTANVKAPFWLSHAAFTHLASQQGSIINITDIHAQHPLKNYSVYCQSKAALAMQTKALAREFAPKVRVNAIAPGAIAWPEHENKLNKAMQEKIIAQTLLKQHGKPEYIAKAVLALANNEFITGQCLTVDGGRVG